MPTQGMVEAQQVIGLRTDDQSGLISSSCHPADDILSVATQFISQFTAVEYLQFILFTILVLGFLSSCMSRNWLWSCSFASGVCMAATAFLQGGMS